MPYFFVVDETEQCKYQLFDLKWGRKCIKKCQKVEENGPEIFPKRPKVGLKWSRSIQNLAKT